MLYCVSSLTHVSVEVGVTLLEFKPPSLLLLVYIGGVPILFE